MTGYYLTGFYLLQAGIDPSHHGLIQQTFNTCVCPPESSFPNKAGGTGDFSDDLNAAAPLH
jgi:hypothetical protein